MIQDIMSKIAREQARKIDFEFFKLLDKHNISIQDVKDKKYILTIQDWPYYENPKWTRYSIRKRLWRNAKKDIDYFIIETTFNIN